MIINIESNDLKQLDLFSYFICYCLFKNDAKSLESYCKIHPISEKSIENAIKNGYLSSDRKVGDDFYVSNIKLLSKFQEEFFPVLISSITPEFAWQQILIHYPNKVKTKEGETRYLHVNEEGAKKKYLEYICKNKAVDEEEHSFVLQAINHLINIKSKGNSLGYLNALPVYINQKQWNAVRDDVMEIIKTKGSISKSKDGDDELKDERL